MYKHLIGQCDTSLVDTYISDGYIQHSPSVKDGKAGIIEALEILKKMPRNSNAPSPIIRTIADGDLVAVQLQLAFMGKQLAVVDIFRLQDGKLAEHWDATQQLPADMPVITNGAITAQPFVDTNESRTLVEDFYKQLIDKNEAGAAKYLAEGYIKHYRGINDKYDDFLAERMQVEDLTVCRILAEGNFAVVQTKGVKENAPLVFYDIFNISDNRIVEHWGVQQQIPATMPHANGMI